MTNENKDKPKNAYKTILSLDGGGIRGLITARILQEIEERTDRRIHELFDLIVGTSTGGILAVALAGQSENKTGKAPVAAEDLVELYSERGREIFDSKIWSMRGHFDERYDAENLVNILRDILGDAELRYTKPDIIVTSYDIERRTPYLFKTSKARCQNAEEFNRNHYLHQIARATTAAPTYFEAFLLDENHWEGKDKSRALIDGGVFANNPSMIGLSEALSSESSKDEILLCAIGTGMHYRPIPYSEAKDWGLLGWIKPLFSVMMDGMSDSADYHVRKLLPGKEYGNKQRYFRFDISLTTASDDLDAVSKANILALNWEAEKIIKEQSEELELLSKKLQRDRAD